MKVPFSLIMIALLMILAQPTIAQTAAQQYINGNNTLSQKSTGRIYLGITAKDYKALINNNKDLVKETWIKGKYPNDHWVISVKREQAKRWVQEYPDIWQPTASHFKIDEKLPESGQVDVVISFFDAMPKKSLVEMQEMYDLAKNEWSIDHPQLLMVNMDAAMLEAIASLPEVAYINLMENDAQPLGEVSRAYHHTGVAQSATATTPLRGTGMVVGVGDGGELGNHIDFEERVINYASGTFSSYGDHGDKSAGLIAGGGNIKEAAHGYAPDATILTQKTFRVFYYLDEYYHTDGMRLTNNSYGSSFSCSYNGRYDYYSSLMDGQINEYEDVLHVVAAGNNGTATCGAYPAGYNTVLKTYATAKNVLTVGAVQQNGNRFSSSAAGPVMDGRIKPEIMTVTEGIQSTSNNYNYGGAGGTSAAAANATGATTLLYQQLKEQHDRNDTPKGALVKAILCNTADDGGNPGPDFQYGYGVLNLRKALQAAELNYHKYDSLQTTGQETTFTFDVPDNQTEFRVMLAWSDIPQPVSGADALMNDLDLEVIAPDGTVFQPWVLNPTSFMVTQNATRGQDHTNVLEQVTLDNPQAGTYTIRIKAHALQSSNQDFALSYWVESPEIAITYPVSGTKFQTDGTAYIAWDANLPTETSYLIEYALSGSTAWQTIATQPAGRGFYQWNTAGLQKENIRIRIKGQTTGVEAISEPFHILPSPANFSITEECGSSLKMQWDEVAGATSYELFMLQGKRMEKVAEVTTNTYQYTKRFEIGAAYWFAVRAVFPNGGISLRTDAQRIIPEGLYPCPWSTDVEIITINTDSERGRAYTSQSLSDSKQLEVLFFNAGQDALSGIALNISINGTVYTENITATIQPGDSLTYTTSQTFDLSAAAEYDWGITAQLPNDNQLERNIWIDQSVQLDNPPIAIPSLDNMDTYDATLEIQDSTFGVIGLEAMDFYTTNSVGRATFRELSSDRNMVLHLENNSNTLHSEVIFTQNLPQNQDVYLKLDYRIMNQENAAVSFFVRGEDTDDWLDLGQLEIKNDWITTPHIVSLTDSLAAINKSVSPSTQLRFVLTGNVQMDINELAYAAAPEQFLPVEMLYFRAEKIGKNTQLEWATASEENNDYFEVQVAKGNIDLAEGNWEVLDIVQGNGTTTEETLYHFIDIEKAKIGNRYYRLKQVDFDGTYEYSNVVVVNFDDNALSDFVVYPNPAKLNEAPRAKFSIATDQQLHLSLVNTNGQTLYTDKVDLEAGGHDIALKTNHQLSPGIYYLIAQLGNGKTYRVKIVKLED